MLNNVLISDEELGSGIEDILGDSERDDWRLLYRAPACLEILSNLRMATDSPSGDLRRRMKLNLPGDFKIDLTDVPLTNRQLMAVSLVFYSGMGKGRAADVMEITHQSLCGHLQSAIKRMKEFFRPHSFYGNKNEGGESI